MLKLKTISTIVCSCLMVLAPAMDTQADDLTIKDLCAGAYRADRIGGVNPLNDGESYARISADGKQVVSYSFATGKQQAVLFDVATARDVKLNGIDGYILSPDEKKMLIQTKTTPIYRHTFTAVYYIYDIANKTLEPLSDGGPQMSPKFSKDGTMVGFVRDNNLFIVKLIYNNAESQVTTDGKPGSIINGIPDWVNEEEFSSRSSFDFSADGTMIAWIKYDESQVKEFSFPWYKGDKPAKDEYLLYPGEYKYKYPMAGTTNSTVTVQTFDIKARVTRTIKLPLEADGYIPRIKFTNDPARLAVFTLNRHQDCLDIYMANPRSTECKKVVQDKVDKYINETVFRNLAFYDNQFVLASERNGYNHLYLYDLNGNLKRPLTNGKMVVQDFYGMNPHTGMAYFSACMTDDPMHTYIYSSDAKGRITKLSTQTGCHDAVFSKNFNYYMNVFSNATTPTVTTLCNKNGKPLTTLEDNKALREKLAHKNLGKVEFFTFTTSEGVKLNGYMVKPALFDASKKYPVIMFQYSGPGSQQVIDSWNAGNMGGMLYEHYLTQQGYICVCVDGRGTGGRGAAFEKCTYLNLGKLESKDQVETALYLGKQSYVDASRIGIWGWSFGGFNTLMSMSEGRPVFAAGVAVAPVTNYRFYDTVYTERFMRTPQENAAGYNDSPMARAGQLSGELLICHGTADDNVHFRNSMEYAESLTQAGKMFMMLPYNNRNHGIYGGNTRCHLFTGITRFFNDKLK